MSWNEYLIHRARKKASRKKRIYGVEPPPVVADLLAQERTAQNSNESFRLIAYILFKSPQLRLKLIWRYLTDRDTPVRRDQIDTLAQEFKSHVSESCRVATNYFERRNYARDLACVPPFLEKTLGIEARFQLCQGAADGIGVVSCVNHHLPALDADPIHPAGIEYPDGLSISHGQTGQVPSPGGQVLQQRAELRVKVLLPGEALLGALDGLRQTLPAVRL